MTTNRKTSFKTVSGFIDLGYFQLICQMLPKFSGVKSERTVFKFRKNNKKICCVHLVYKVNAWNWEVSRRSRATSAKKCTKKRDARAKFLLCYLNLLLFCRSRCRRRRRCLSSILFWSKNCATMVTWRHTSLFCNTFCKSNHNIHLRSNGLTRFGFFPVSLSSSMICAKNATKRSLSR